MTYITALPTPPNRADDPTTFSSRADALLGALPTFVTEANALRDEVNDLRDATEADKLATDGLKAGTQGIYDAAVADTATIKAQTQAIYDDAVTDTNAIKAAAIAACEVIEDACDDRRTDCQTFRDQALTYKNGAEAAAAAAGSAAGLPSITGKAGHSLVVNEAGTAVAWNQPYQRLPIFSAAAVTKKQVSNLEDLAPDNTRFATGLSSGQYVAAVDDLFIAASGVASSNFASSPDGKVWTLRAAPSSATWRIMSDGARALGYALNATAIALTTDGITWTSGTALPGNTLHSPVSAHNNGRWLIQSGTTSTAYLSTNFGTSWSTVTLPANGISLVSIAGMFVYWSAGTTYYTSETGETGSWTTRTMPEGATMYTLSDGSIATTKYRSVDGINWALLPFADANICNGVWFTAAAAFGGSKTFHNDTAVVRTATSTISTKTPSAVNSTATCFNSGTVGYVWTIDLNGANGPTALFE